MEMIDIKISEVMGLTKPPERLVDGDSSVVPQAMTIDALVETLSLRDGVNASKDLELTPSAATSDRIVVIELSSEQNHSMGGQLQLFGDGDVNKDVDKDVEAPKTAQQEPVEVSLEYRAPSLERQNAMGLVPEGPSFNPLLARGGHDPQDVLLGLQEMDIFIPLVPQMIFRDEYNKMSSNHVRFINSLNKYISRVENSCKGLAKNITSDLWCTRKWFGSSNLNEMVC